MEELKIGQKVRLAIDKESEYEIIEINPDKGKSITIKNLNDEVIVEASEIEIIVID